MDRVAMTLLQECWPSAAAPDISQHSRNHWTSKCARLWKGSWPPETVWIHLDPVLQKLRTGCTEGQHLHILGDAAAPSATNPGDLKDHRKHLPGEGGLQPGNNPPSLSVGLSKSLTDILDPVYFLPKGRISCVQKLKHIWQLQGFNVHFVMIRHRAARE